MSLVHKRISRRGLMKGTAAVTGAAIGTGGFPDIWAQNIKDVVLRHAGPPVTALSVIGAQATKTWAHRADAGDRERRPAQSHHVAVERDRLQAISASPTCPTSGSRYPADDPSQEGQVWTRRIR